MAFKRCLRLPRKAADSLAQNAAAARLAVRARWANGRMVEGNATRVRYRSPGGAPGEALLASPLEPLLAPAVVVLQDGWGVNEHIRSVLLRLARAGFLAAAPDLFEGRVATSPDQAEQHAAELDRTRAIDLVDGAVRVLREHPRCSGSVGGVGFALGGSLVWSCTSRIPSLAAGVVFYGIAELQDAELTAMRAPLLAHFGGRDPVAKVQDARRLKRRLLAAGGQVELCEYEAGHAFLNDSRPDAYDPTAATLAWDRTVAFLHDHLG